MSVQIWKTLGLSQPSFQRRVGEDEADRLLEGEQSLLVAHDQLEGLPFRPRGRLSCGWLSRQRRVDGFLFPVLLVLRLAK